MTSSKDLPLAPEVMDQKPQPTEPIDPAVLEWAEALGIANMKQRDETAKWLKTQAASTLTVLLAGVGGSLAYAARIAQGAGGPVEWGAAAFCVWLMACSVALVLKCLMVDEFPAVWNEPANLAVPGFTVNQLREHEIANLQRRIRNAVTVNDTLARWLNRVRAAAVASPAAFLLGAGVATLARYLICTGSVST